jgi:hypothetical protein
MNSKFILSVLLFMIGALVYLAVSEGPWRVRAVVVPAQIVYLLSVAYLAWVPKLDLVKRLLVIVMAVMLGSLTSVWLDSLVVMKMRPLTAIAVAVGVLAYAIEAALFLLGVSILDGVVERVLTRRRQTPP